MRRCPWDRPGQVNTSGETTYIRCPKQKLNVILSEQAVSPRYRKELNSSGCVRCDAQLYLPASCVRRPFWSLSPCIGPSDASPGTPAGGWVGECVWGGVIFDLGLSPPPPPDASLGPRATCFFFLHGAYVVCLTCILFILKRIFRCVN